MRYDNDNIFAKILRGEIPCHKIYEDDSTLSFMDIMPRSPDIAWSFPRYRRATCSILTPIHWRP